MTLFDGVYPFYPQHRKAAVFDISTIIVTVVFLTLACCFLLIIPGIRGRARLYWTLRVLLSLFVGVVIVVVQFTGDWERGWVQANTSYKSFSPAQVSADIGLHIGLAGLNVTLRGNPVQQINETINYNEHFSWSFGADYELSYSQGLHRGLPSPILYVAEKFSGQSPCGVHGQYRIAGHYASAMLWVAFCTWIISNILLSMPALVYGGYMLLATGAFMIFSLLSFSTVRSSLMCPIQIGSSTLHVAYGGSFWLMLAVGLLCLVAGTTVVAMHHLNLDLLKTFFDLREDKAEEHQELPEVFINPHFVSKSQSPSEPTEINSV
ncbi:dual oxidase maturation factor 2 [Melozone crissalis]|uniref:dual oxidase maturation factor 2 n=1 Tax=Melozone crissalis TaxID=40204 RepID=UPI0023D9B85C|nr:dual oxidase maturation factor 2 [Melozone crissalis]